MASNLEINPVTKAARVLHAVAPVEFRGFVAAMQEYSDQLARETVAADTTGVMYAQGGARRIARLTNWFIEIEKS